MGGDPRSAAAKRAIEVAVAGRHSILLLGPPGCGKTALLTAARQLTDGSPAEIFERRPCPCGWHGSAIVPCECSPSELATRRHLQDVLQAATRVRLMAVSATELLRLDSGDESSRAVRARIRHAEAAQNIRGARNAELTAEQLRQSACPGEVGANLLRDAVQRGGLSAAGFYHTLHIARSVADLDASDEVKTVHLVEARGYQETPRPIDRDDVRPATG